MQSIIEPIFNAIYLFTVTFLGITMLNRSKNDQYFKLFGIMAIVLGVGDGFHLIPRTYALLTTGLTNYPVALGFGKFVTSITMTIFYLILFRIWEIRFNIKNDINLRFIMFILTTLRIALCIFPQNKWLTNNSPLSWGIYRNIPFALMGIIIIYLLYSYGAKNNDNDYKMLSIAVVLSFAFYTPVVLFASVNKFIGMLMIPKTLAYVWIVLIGYKEFVKAGTSDLKSKFH